MDCDTCEDHGYIGACGPDGEPNGEPCPDCNGPLPFTEISQETAEHALRLMYRLSLWTRTLGSISPELAVLSQEQAQLLCDLPPGTIDQLAEAKPGTRASDKRVP